MVEPYCVACASNLRVPPQLAYGGQRTPRRPVRHTPAPSPGYATSSSLTGGVHSLLESAEGACRDIKRAESAESADRQTVLIGTRTHTPPDSISSRLRRCITHLLDRGALYRAMRTVLRTSAGPLCLWHSASAALLAKRCRGARAERALCKHSYPAR